MEDNDYLESCVVLLVGGIWALAIWEIICWLVFIWA